MKIRHLSAALLLLVSLAPSLAWAQSSDEDRGTARELTLEGNQSLDKKDYAHAASCFERAEALFHAPTILIGLARARVGLGKLVGAREAYNRIINETVPANAAPAFLKAIEDSRRELAALAPRVPSVIIDIQGPPLATVTATIDGTAISSAALGAKRPADPGSHVVRVGAPGFETAEVTVSVTEGKTETVTVVLKAGQGIPPVATQPEVKPSPPAQPMPFTPMGPDQSAPSGSPLKTVGFVSLGVGAAGLVVGAITGGLALAKHGSVVGQCTNGLCPPRYQSDIDSYKTLGTISTAGFVAGGVLGATGVVLVLTAPKAKSQGASITPLIGLGYLGARGSF